MNQEIKALLIALIKKYPFLKRVLNVFFFRNLMIKKMLLQTDYLKQQIYSYYSNESLAEKRFYNFGAGFQRSEFEFWSYVDLKSDAYDQRGIDLFFDLESLGNLPIEDDYAEVIFNSFVIEHISKEATNNLCKEAFRTLKKGGVFHSKIHSYDYGLQLLDARLVSPKIPFEHRECRSKVDAFIKKHHGKVRSEFIDGSYRIHALKDSNEFIAFSPANAFAYHNAAAAVQNLQEQYGTVEDGINELKQGVRTEDFFSTIKARFVDDYTKQPYQHNADYYAPEELLRYLKSLGFSQVYFTQPYQSISPALWEERLNPMHYGFLFSIEAVK